MIPAKTQYKTHNNKLLAMVEVFKTWWHYIKSCKHKVLILTDYNNFCCFMDMKNLSSCQGWWAQQLTKYHFWINYCQSKVHRAADALSHFPQQENEEKANLPVKNTWILPRLQCSLTNASISRLHAIVSSLLPQHQVLICGTYVLPQLWHFWNNFRTELADEQPYKASISRMRLRLQEL